VQDYATKTILYSIYFLVFLGGLVRAFLGPTIFLLSYWFKKSISNAATWSSSVWQIASVVDLQLLVFHYFDWSSLVYVFCFACSIFLRAFLSQIEKKPIMNQNRGTCNASLSEGIKFVFNNKTVLGAITLDMVAVLLVEL
jgi:hypothetical protein